MIRVRFGLDQIERAAERLARASPERIGLAAREVVNAVADDLRRRSIEGASQRINLTPQYVSGKIRLEAATAGQARAEVVAVGDLTILGNYRPFQRRAGANAGPGRRPAGVDIEVRRGSALYRAQWFTMTLRGGGKTGVFVRPEPGAKPKHLYGPSPYSLLRQQATHRNAEFTEALASAAVEGIGAVLEDVL